jgi:hypothetical protein
MQIHEIVTVNSLVQPTPDQLTQITKHATNHYRDDLYFSQDGANITVVRKVADQTLGLVISIAYYNPRFEQIPKFVVPRNLYSWANDQGTTALKLIKALIKLSPLPVVSDLEMTSSAKRFFEKQIDAGALKARTLNLNTGDVTPYSSTVWRNDDEERVLILDQPLGIPMSDNLPKIMETTWNHKKMLRSLLKIDW